MSTYQDVANAESAEELVKALRGAKPGTPNLVGDFLGSWDTPAIYLDAWADTRSERSIEAGLRVPVDTDILRLLKMILKEGEVDGRNPCLDGTYDDNDLAPRAFAEGKADALFGYSERLFHVVKHGLPAEKVRISSAPMGDGSDPVWFVDAFVLRQYGKDMDDTARKAKVAAAEKFTAYMNDAKTFTWIHCSEDLGKNAPRRYLIPATKSAFLETEIGGDPIMKQLLPVLGRGTHLPQYRMAGIRKSMRNEILEALKQP